MGTHVNGPSKLEDGSELSKFLNNNYMTTDLLYLLKVLSINDPLSIQIHPNKDFAAVLHEKDEINYKDANHKPELAIVISEKFSLLYGFKDIAKGVKIIKMLNNNDCFGKHSKLYKLIEELLNDENNLSIYKQFFLNLVNLDSEECENILNAMLSNNVFEKEGNNELALLINLLFGKFGKDKGIIFALFMNYYELKYNNSIFIPPNIPHAYISGDCIECMANSDNVIRIGLTPKFVDNSNFEFIIQNYFNDMIISEYTDIGVKVNEYVTVYSNPHFKDFKLTKIECIDDNTVSYISEYHSILFCLKGDLKVTNKNGYEYNVKQYEAYFIEKDNELNILGKDSLIFIASR
jgi:mannose-6-phosphate isomerase class I